MTTGSKCHTHSSLSNKAAASSLIIQLPTTSAGHATAQSNQQTHSETNPNGCRPQQAARRLLGPLGPAPISEPTTRATNLTATNHQHQHQNHHHHHRYQQNIAHASIDHHLLPQAAGSGAEASARTSSLENGGGGEEPSGTPPPNYHEIPGIVPSYHGRTSGPPPAYDDVVNPNAPPPSYQSLFGQVREARKSSNGLVDLLRQLFLVLIGTLGCTMIIGFLLLIPITMIFIGLFYMNECRAENIPSFLVIGGLVWILKNILNCYNQFKRDSSAVNRPPRRQPISAASRPPSGLAPSALAAENATATGAAAAAADSSQGAGHIATNAQANTTLPSRQVGPAAATPNQTSGPSATTTRSQTAHHVRHPPMIGITSYKCESFLNYFLIVWFLAGCIVIYRIYEPDYENPLSLSYCNRTVYLYAFWLMTSAFITMAVILSCLCCLMASSLMSCSHGR